MHIGQRIREVFDSRPKTFGIKAFCQQLYCTRSNLYDIFSRQTIDSELLRRISEILEHDFFQDLSDEMNQIRGKDKPI